MRYVIISGSAAAIGCIEGVRSVDKTGEIILITGETEWNYSRPLISYLLEGKTTRDKMWCRPDSFFTRNGVTVKAGVLATTLDAGDRTVRLSTGERLAYDRLLAATGSRPFVPPIPGLETVERTFCFQTLSDASALAEALRPESRVLILGAGLTGVKCAEGIRGLCAQIAIADLAPRVLPAVLDDTAAAMVQARMEEKGVRFYLNDSAAAFRGNTARLQSGTELEFDVLVTAVGVRPNTQLVADAGGAVDRGILVDGRCATTLPDVYAAGDCAQGYDAVSGEKRMLPLWPNAMLQGETAGINMAGGRADYTQGIALNASGVFGLHMVTAGSYEGESFTVQRDGSYKRLVTADGVLKGVIMVGDVSRAGIYTDLIRKKKPLSEIDFDLIRESPQLMAFSQKDRRVQLGGEV
ncbi:NAD(P)/FAD-dependent oxidoreductase [Ruthenibacterium lactatiformans]|uniref:NAD(P)/FAD-dependent oxidoreductase n=1 Tax=Ruthenibacterium lactatiformans TaxID=1550024 RepID=UPI003AF16D9D